MHTENLKKAGTNYNLTLIIPMLLAGQKTSVEIAEGIGVDKKDALDAIKVGMSQGSIRKTKAGFNGPVVYVLSEKAAASLKRVVAETELVVPALAAVPAEVAPSPTVETEAAPAPAPAPKQLLQAPRRGVDYAAAYVDQMRASYESELPVMPGVEKDYIGRRFVGLLGEGSTVAQAKAHLARYVRVVADHTASFLASAAVPASPEDVARFVDKQSFARVQALPVD